jgi:hypothetical protein
MTNDFLTCHFTGALPRPVNFSLHENYKLGNYLEMSKKDKDSVLDDYEKVKYVIIHDKMHEILRNHPKDYIAKLAELGFEYFEDDDDNEEMEERKVKSRLLNAGLNYALTMMTFRRLITL